MQALPPSPVVSAFQYLITAIVLILGAFKIVSSAASRYFVANFEGGYPQNLRSMSIGREGGEPDGDMRCAVCGKEAKRRCSGCKNVIYCSSTCQVRQWEDHKSKCKKKSLPADLDNFSLNGSSKRKGFSSISLVPGRGYCTVLQEPKKILFPYKEFVELFNGDRPGISPCGLLNCGNSCYVNVVLQCLSSTQPLTAYLLERDHSRYCIRKKDDWCFLCDLQIHVRRASKSFQPFSPLNILSRLSNIGGNLGYGRQEDAHEFMRFAIDTMQSICLDEYGGEKELDSRSQETTLIQYIFGGHLCSQVICTKCNAVSGRYENMMDLTVEIQGDAWSLEDCLNQFTAKEWLDGENMYKCDGCNAYVKAWKRLTVHQAPNILTITLKRFQAGKFGKLNKRVSFPEVLDLTPYMSGTGDGTNLYMLYAVVVHVDMLNAAYFGHYICYTKDSHGNWYRIDDCMVVNVGVEEVLNQGAYMILYSRKKARKDPFISPLEPNKKKSRSDPDASSCPESDATLLENRINGNSCDDTTMRTEPARTVMDDDTTDEAVATVCVDSDESLQINSLPLGKFLADEQADTEIHILPEVDDLQTGSSNSSSSLYPVFPESSTCSFDESNDSIASVKSEAVEDSSNHLGNCVISSMPEWESNDLPINFPSATSILGKETSVCSVQPGAANGLSDCANGFHSQSRLHIKCGNLDTGKLESAPKKAKPLFARGFLNEETSICSVQPGAANGLSDCARGLNSHSSGSSINGNIKCGNPNPETMLESAPDKVEPLFARGFLNEETLVCSVQPEGANGFSGCASGLNSQSSASSINGNIKSGNQYPGKLESAPDKVKPLFGRGFLNQPPRRKKAMSELYLGKSHMVPNHESNGQGP